ncbi:hypothetical protein [Bacillus cereus]|uniref:hypothetical protein n=1 Tax=Bacillus cereus TaxID=1396 RepID=UPI001E659A8E|nr:hypothetical protein [Bacillus cereus]
MEKNDITGIIGSCGNCDNNKLQNFEIIITNGELRGMGGEHALGAAKKALESALNTEENLMIDPQADYSEMIERFGGKIIKINPDNTTTINPFDMCLNDDAKNREAFSYSLQNMYGFLEQHIGDNLTQYEKDELYRVFMKNNNVDNQMHIGDIYKELLERKNRGNKRLLRLIDTFGYLLIR